MTTENLAQYPLWLRDLFIKKYSIPGQKFVALEAWHYFFNRSDETELYISFVLLKFQKQKWSYLLDLFRYRQQDRDTGPSS